jgi:hypothetical protein
VQNGWLLDYASTHLFSRVMSLVRVPIDADQILTIVARPSS